MKHILSVLSVTVLCSAAFAQDYDVVILNGRVIDPETGMDAVRNVGIVEDRIAAIG